MSRDGRVGAKVALALVSALILVGAPTGNASAADLPPGTECTTKIVKKHRFLRYDEHAVELACTKVAPGTRVRGRAEFTMQPDEVTPWLTAPGTVVSPYRVRTVLDLPRDEIEYRIG